MKLQTYIAKYYKVDVESEAISADSSAQEHKIWIELKSGDWTEGLGYFLKLDGCDTYQWNNVCSNVQSGTAFANEAAVKAAIKAQMFK